MHRDEASVCPTHHACWIVRTQAIIERISSILTLALGKSSGFFIDALTEGNTPWPEYTKARMPKTIGMDAQLAADVTAPGGKLPATCARSFR